VGQMPSVRKVEAHQAVVGVHQGRVDVEVRGSTGESCMVSTPPLEPSVQKRLTLDVDTPLPRIQAKRLQRALLAQLLGGINEFVAAVVPCAGVPLGVFIC
jgi:hypothetical protein